MSNVRVKSWDGHNINDGVNYTATVNNWPAFQATEVSSSFRTRAMPVIGNNTYQEGRVALEIQIESSSQVAIDALNKQLSEWFDPRDNESKPLLIANKDGSNERYVMARPVMDVVTDGTARTKHAIQLALDGLGDPDGRFRTATYTTDDWAITASGQTNTVNNAGEDDAYPIFRITPTTSKTAGFAYKAWIPIRWNVDVGHQHFPLMFSSSDIDIADLISNSKLQADADDLRFFNNGIEINRWLKADLSGVWVNLTFEGKQEVTLEEAIASTGDVLVIDVNESIDAFPPSGVLMIDDEAFVYTAKVNHLKRFTGVTRAQRGTSMAAHDVGDTVWWVQNDLWVFYGDSTLDAPVIDEAQSLEPAFDIDQSTNGQWLYENFGSFDTSSNSTVPRDLIRPGSWFRHYIGYDVTLYTTNRNTPPPAEDWVEVGIHCPTRPPGQFSLPIGRWAVYHPCGISSRLTTAGEKRSSHPQYWNRTTGLSAKWQSSMDGIVWNDEATITAPSVKDTWEAWASNGALTYSARYLGLYLGHDPGDGWLELSTVNVVPDTGNLPTIAVGAEQENYPLAATITNNTTGESIVLNFHMELDETIVVDTDAKTITYEKDGSSQFQAMELVDGPRRDWLRLAPGNNELQFDDTDTGDVDIQISWQMRWWD